MKTWISVPVLLVVLCANVVAGVPDSTSGKFSIAVRPAFGFTIAHRPALEPLQEKHIRGLEFSIARKTHGENDWENVYRFPDYGITVAVFDLGSRSRLGTGIAAYPYIDFPLGKNAGNGLHFRYGIGLGYIEKIFDPETNIKNAAIGTHLNGVIHFDLHIEKSLGPRTALEFGAGITHFSTGSYSLPNLGLNIAEANVAFRRSFGNRSAYISIPLPPPDKKVRLHVHAGGFLKKVYPPRGRNFFAATVSGLIIKPFNHKSAWGAGVDLFFDNSISYRITRLGENKAGSLDNFRQGLYGSYELFINKIGVGFNMGYYLFNAWKDDGNIYHRIVLNYYLDKIFFCLNLKTHYARADMVELGAGYRFDFQKSKNKTP